MLKLHEIKSQNNSNYLDDDFCRSPELGRVILRPLTEGRVLGLSFAVLPYCEPLSDWSPVWRIQRRRLRRGLFDWLRLTAQQTVAEVEPDRIERDFLRPLEHLVELEAMTDRVCAAAGGAIERLRNGVWRPRYVLMHGDLFRRNILIDVSNASASRRRRWVRRFVVIDWPGARLDGYAICDLIRLAQSMKLPGRRLLDEVRRHCRLLQCEALDACSYLLAGLGHLGMNLEHFPREHYVRAADLRVQALRAVGL